MRRQTPEIGSWFENIETGQIFEIVALDELHNTIEVQHLDGSLDEFDGEYWGQMSLIPAAAPEDANAGYEVAGEEQLLDTDTSSPLETHNPLDEIETESFIGTDEFP